MKKTATIVLAAALAAIVLGACGSTDEKTPIACLEGSGTYLKALEAAPGAVRLDGETPISDCLTENQDAGDLTAVGEAMVEAATRLSAEAREDPGGEAGVELGYLAGAAQHGAEETQGIHDELVRRLLVAARYSPAGRPLPAAFVRSYKQGYKAGQTTG